MESGIITEKDEFTNTSRGQCGAIVVENGKEKGIAVRPGDTVLLSEIEQTLTANAHRRNEDNPFINGTLKMTGKASEMRHRRPIGRDVGMDAAPEADAPAAEQQKAAAEAQAASNDRAKADAERKARIAAEQARAKKEAAAGGLPSQPAQKGAEGKVAEETAAAGAGKDEETGAAVAPAGESAKGERAKHEEVGTPEAPRQAKS